VRFIYIGSLGDARQQVSSGKYGPGAGLKTIGERGDDASDDTISDCFNFKRDITNTTTTPY